MPASRPAAHSSESAPISSRVPSPSSVSSASVGETRRRISSSGASKRTSIRHSYGRRASIRTTCAAGSNPGSRCGRRLADLGAADAVGAERAQLAALAVVRRDVPPAATRDEAERLDHARARRAVAARVVDLEAAVPPHRLRDREQRFARGRRRRRRLADEADLVAEALDPPGEPLREDAGDLRQRVPGVDPAPARDDEPERRPRSPRRRRASAAAGASRRGAGSRRRRPGWPSTGMPMSCSATAYRRIVRSVTPRSVAAARPSTTGRAWSISRKASSREAGRDTLRIVARLRTKTVLNRS